MDEQLYSEILYKILHFKGCDADLERSAILEYFQKASEVDEKMHSHLLEVTKLRKVNAIYACGTHNLKPIQALC